MRVAVAAGALVASVFAGLAGCTYDYGALGGHLDVTVGGTGGDGSGGKATAIGTGGNASAGSGGHLGTGGGNDSTGTGGSSGGTGSHGTGGSDSGDGGATGGGGSEMGKGGSGTGGSGTGASGTGGKGTGGVGTGGKGTGGVATGGGGTGAGGNAADPDLVLWYKFDETSGGIALDSSGAAGGPRNGALLTGGTGGAVGFSSTHQVGTHSLSLSANATTGGGYLGLPAIAAVAPYAVTISTWIYSTSNRDWQRVFDFGSGATVNMFLCTSEGSDTSNYVRFAITTAGNLAEQRITTTTVLTQNVWHHLAVVLAAGSPYTGTVYIDGVAAGTNAAMTLHAVDMGVTLYNYIGKSQFLTDAYLAGMVDDFRIYKRALTAAEITALRALR